MPEWFCNSFAAGQELALEPLVYRLCAAGVLGGAVAAIYWLTHRRDDSLAPTFISTLVLLAIVIAMVTQVIGDNQARAFSLVGALAIIRFRTVVEDTRDTAFVILSVVVGMAAGADHLAVALVGLVLAAVAAALLRPRRAVLGPSAPVWTLAVRVGIGQSGEERLAAALRQHCDDVDLVASATGRQGAALDLTYKVRLRAASTATAVVAELNRLEGVQSVELRRAQ